TPGSRRRRRLSPLLLLVLAGLAGIAAVVAFALSRTDGGGGGGADGGSAGGGTSSSVALTGVGSWDPYGNDGQEHSADAPKAADGNESTYWQTSSYRYPDGGLGKPGVGVVLDAGRTVGLDRLTVSTDTPGFTAKIQAGASPTGPFHDDSGS